MIIQLRGTSGSGKTWVMKQLMQKLGPFTPRYTNGRKKPISYMTEDIVVLGHYESACGGCDNIGSAAAVFELMRCYKDSPIILAEGLLLSEDTKWSLQMEDLRVVYLTTTLDTCLQQITNRRLAAGNTKELNPKNTTNRVKVVERSRLKLLEAGVICKRATTTQAVKIVLDWIHEKQTQHL
jgi:hypothetical protein